MHEALGDAHGMASAQGMMGFVIAVEGDLVGAETTCAAALNLAKAVGHHNVIAWTHLDLAVVRLLQKDFAAAKALCTRSLALRNESVRSHEWLAAALQVLAAVAVETGHPERAMKLFGAASIQWETSATIYWLWDRVMRERWLSKANSRLGADTNVAYEAGRKMTTDEAIVYARDVPIGALARRR